MISMRVHAAEAGKALFDAGVPVTTHLCRELSRYIEYGARFDGLIMTIGVADLARMIGPETSNLCHRRDKMNDEKNIEFLTSEIIRLQKEVNGYRDMFRRGECGSVLEIRMRCGEYQAQHDLTAGEILQVNDVGNLVGYISRNIFEALKRKCPELAKDSP